MSVLTYILLFLVGTEGTDMSRFPRVPQPDYRPKTEKCAIADETLNSDMFAAQCGIDSAYPYVELWNCSYFCCADVDGSTIGTIRLYNAVDFVNCGNEIYVATTVRDDGQGSIVGTKFS